MLQVCRGILKESPLIIFMFISTLIGWALKQVINVIQVTTLVQLTGITDIAEVNALYFAIRL
jgi:CDP-diacylglycerol--inositol 3-phosphatidyltransferase